MNRPVVDPAGLGVMDAKRFQDADIVLQRVGDTTFKVLKTSHPEDFLAEQLITESAVLKWFSGLKEPVDVVFLPGDLQDPATLTFTLSELGMLDSGLGCYISEYEGVTGHDVEPFRKLRNKLRGE